MSMFVGCAGWNVPKEFAELFPTVGTHLDRYSTVLNAVEINSSFYRSHRVSSYERWANSTPKHFRFSVKLPRIITHLQRLVDTRRLIEQFRGETSGLGEKLGPILVQLPPSVTFDRLVSQLFFSDLRAEISSAIVCEPRHSSWFGHEADTLMKDYAIARVAADPFIVPAAAETGGDHTVCYFRWHGSPSMYYSSYDDNALSTLATRVRTSAASGVDVWCIFDNTARGAAARNALSLVELVDYGCCPEFTGDLAKRP